MTLTIGLPVFNGERYLHHSITSILEQTHRDFELIISDNASTDGTAAICRDFARADARVRYIREEVNRGAAWNFNRLVDLATQPLFKWTTADDLHEPTHVERCVAALRSNPDAVLAYTRTVFIDENDGRMKEYTPGWHLTSADAWKRLQHVVFRGGHWVNADPLLGVIRTDALRRTRLLPTYQGGDKRPIGELSLLGTFVEVPEYLLLRRKHHGASNSNNPSVAGYDRASVEWMVRFFNASQKQIVLPTWSLFADHVRTAWRSRLSVIDKLRLTYSVTKSGYQNRHFLLEELAAAARFAARRS